MARTLWLALVALAAALVVTVGAWAAQGGGDGCPGGYEPLTVSVDDPLNIYNENHNGYICVYVGANKRKDLYIDDNERPPKKQL